MKNYDDHRDLPVPALPPHGANRRPSTRTRRTSPTLAEIIEAALPEAVREVEEVTGRPWWSSPDVDWSLMQP